MGFWERNESLASEKVALATIGVFVICMKGL